jgi:hypothetical protein
MTVEHRLYVVHLARLDDLSPYRDFLTTRLYPAIDGLTSARLIDGYYFLRHDVTLDLCLRVRPGVDEKALADGLRKQRISQQPAKDPGSISVEEVDRLNAVSRLVRLLQEAGNTASAFQYAVHYACNQLGLCNAGEAAWHALQVDVWLSSALRQSALPITSRLLDEARAAMRLSPGP